MAIFLRMSQRALPRIRSLRGRAGQVLFGGRSNSEQPWEMPGELILICRQCSAVPRESPQTFRDVCNVLHADLGCDVLAGILGIKLSQLWHGDCNLQGMNNRIVVLVLVSIGLVVASAICAAGLVPFGVGLAYSLAVFGTGLVGIAALLRRKNDSQPVRVRIVLSRSRARSRR
jgi:hypothetical protein